MSNGREVLGFSPTIPTLTSNDFLFQFRSTGRWGFQHGEKELMKVIHGQPVVNEEFDFDKFQEFLRGEFPSAEFKGIAAITSFLRKATEPSHGALVVLCEDAADEVSRLGSEGNSVAPFVLDLFSDDLPIARQLTAVDGAVFLDPNGLCHGIGIILDGLSSIEGRAERGSRYNSASRYVHWRRGINKKTIAFVVSSDGTIDVIPRTY